MRTAGLVLAVVTFKAVQPTHVLILSRAEIREPVVFDGNFMMNEPSQIEAARARYEAAATGSLSRPRTAIDSGIDSGHYSMKVWNNSRAAPPTEFIPIAEETENDSADRPVRFI